MIRIVILINYNESNRISNNNNNNKDNNNNNNNNKVNRIISIEPVSSYF